MSKSLRAVLLPVLAVVVLGLALFFFLSDNRESIKKGGRGTGISAPDEAEEADPRPKRIVKLMFLAEERSGFVPEEREIVADEASPSLEAREIVAELIKGSRTGLLSAVPSETKLIQVYVTKDGTAYVDFSREFAECHPSGTSAEMETIYAVVDSLAYNLTSVKKVCLLIDGEERETLAGHIAINRPIPPDFTLIARNEQ
jgi:spore germination protein GerM